MRKVITYGTFDMLHQGHVNLLKRAKSLGDYLIVGITAEDFDKRRGKINVKQSLMERVEAVKELNIADEIIIEEYEGQKIDDIRRLDVDIFTVGSDWKGKFDYLNEYCKVIYLPRTEGVSSSGLRSQERKIKMGLVGSSTLLDKIASEIEYVNGMTLSGIYSENESRLSNELKNSTKMYETLDDLIDDSDAIYVISHPTKHYKILKQILEKGKGAICESPITLREKQTKELFEIAKANKCILFDANKTAYSTAYNRLLVLVKSGQIGEIVSIDATCTSLEEKIGKDVEYDDYVWNSISAWGPAALLPIFQILSTDFKSKSIFSKIVNKEKMIDAFTKVDFVYDNAVASIKVGKGVKSEGSLVISGTKGYIYVPAPWWKTDYFEVRYEDPTKNKRYFYQLDGEGIRYELVAFSKAIKSNKSLSYITEDISKAISKTIEDFYNKKDVVLI